MSGAPRRRVEARYLRDGVELEDLSCGHTVNAPHDSGDWRICPRCTMRAVSGRFGRARRRRIR